jgi:bifunctional UDP-N-acetylglucosamine pyrophosphorylase/glucosamine-1-phosphate N-acetyltransferase
MNTQIIILAAGHGKRMQSELPKALVSFSGKPFISHILETVATSGVCDDPIIIVGQKREQIIDLLGPSYRYVTQEEQLGTGHAVMMAEKESQGKEIVLVLYADHPLVSSETIVKLIQTHQKTNATITMATTRIIDFLDWRSGFLSFSRVIRGNDGEISSVVEAKDATESQKEITELNPCYFCFDAAWMWQQLHTIKNDNAQKEYYLTDLMKIAFTENKKIASITIDPREAMGVNTKEQLELLENLT